MPRQPSTQEAAIRSRERYANDPEYREKVKERAREKSKANRQSMNEYHRQWKYKSTYGVTREEADELRKLPCEICGRKAPDVLMHIDHSESGSYHGVLCIHCNTAIGHLTHDPEIMQRAVEYVVRTRTKS